MDRLISQQAAIDLINRLDIPEDMCVFEILSHIALAIGTLPPAQPEQRWIPCSERLPDNDESVLISNSHGVTKAWWNGRFWTSIAVKKYKTVIAWMPLPEPYVERRKEWAQLTADGFYRLGNLSRANHMSIWRLHKNLQMAWLYTASLMIIFWIMGM